MRTLLFSLSLCVVCSAQQGVGRVKLSPHEKIASQIDGSVPYMAPIKCDAQGNIYLRPWPSDDVTTLIKLGPDGKQVTKMSFDPPPGDIKGKVRRIVDFTTDSFGSLYVYLCVHGVGKDLSEYLLKYKPDGQYFGATKITTPDDFEVSAFERFPTGELLVNGVVLSGGAKTAIIGNDGEVATWVNVNQTFKKNKDGKLSKSDSIAASIAYTVSSDDGNIWFIRPMMKPTITAISPSGAIVHQFTVEKPAGYEQIDLAVGKGRIMIDFQQESAKNGGNDPELYRIYDSLTGDLVSEYAADDWTWGRFACYVSPSEFVTLQADEKTNRFTIIKATP
jgi:hypothetical protein